MADSNKDRPHSRTLEDMLATLSPEARAEVGARSKVLIEEEKNLHQMRHALCLSQAKIAETLGAHPDTIAHMQNRNDVLISTLQHFIAKAGLEVEFIIKSPNHSSITMNTLDDLIQNPE